MFSNNSDMPVFYGYPVITDMYMLLTLHMEYIDDLKQVYYECTKEQQYNNMRKWFCAYVHSSSQRTLLYLCLSIYI